MLDQLPAPARHLIIAIAAAFGGSIVDAVIAARGVTGLDVALTLRTAVDLAALAGATSSAALWLTPLTRRYGLGKLTDAAGEHVA